MIARQGAARRRAAFTLAELLVVIGIIAVLASILLPALNKARARARETVCMANLRTIGYALTMYTQKYGYYPGGLTFEKDSKNINVRNYIVWAPRLRAMLGPNTAANRNVFYCPAREYTYEWPAEQASPQWPKADALDEGFGYDLGEPVLLYDIFDPSILTNGSGYQGFSYGYNAYGAGGGSAPKARGLGYYVQPRNYISNYEPWTKEIRANTVKRPPEMIAIGDSETTSFGTNLLFLIDPYYWLPGKIHHGGGNILFCDGHVQWKAQSELRISLPNSFNPDPAKVPIVAPMWNRDNSP